MYIMDNTQIRYICYIFIILAHIGVLNKLEKIFTKILFNNNKNINRPSEECKDSYDFNISCIGMPSGHTELATILSLLLVHYESLPISIASLIILLTGLQRIESNRHTIQQVLVGFLFGLGYACFYIKTDMSLKSMLIITGVILLLSLILTLYVDNIIQNDKTPNWVDKDLYPIIKRKKEVPFYIKYCTIMTSIIIEEVPLYIDYKTLEIYLDKCIDIIQESNIKFDAIVGIKSGGAILSNYIAKKLDMTNYVIKFTSKEKECNSNKIKSIDFVRDMILSKRKVNKLCEGIDDNIQGKNIILIDEQVDSGSTMESAIDYLINDKKVNNIYLISITSMNGDRTLNNIHLHYIKPYKYSMIYPWGYDN